MDPGLFNGKTSLSLWSRPEQRFFHRERYASTITYNQDPTATKLHGFCAGRLVQNGVGLHAVTTDCTRLQQQTTLDRARLLDCWHYSTPDLM